MHGGRRDSEVLLHFGLRWRTSVHLAVVINESQILTLFVRVSFLHSHHRISQNSNRLSRGIRGGRFPRKGVLAVLFRRSLRWCPSNILKDCIQLIFNNKRLRLKGLISPPSRTGLYVRTG
jgi:hypothetical protein